MSDKTYVMLINTPDLGEVWVKCSVKINGKGISAKQDYPQAPYPGCYTISRLNNAGWIEDIKQRNLDLILMDNKIDEYLIVWKE